MSATYPNRETLYHIYANTPESDWEVTMGQYAIEGVDCPSKLFYLSLDPTLETNFAITASYDDHLATSSDFYTQEVLTITLPQRMLANTDVQGCWNQVFPKIAECLRTETDYNRPIELYLYKVDVTNCVVIDNHDLVHNHLVHNAFTSNTHAVFGLPKVRMVQHLLVRNTLNYPDEGCTYYHPFNDNKYMQRLLSTPLDILAVKTID